MPVYDFVNEQTGEEWEQHMSYDDMKALTNGNPHIKLLYKTMNIVGGHGDRTKTDGGFKEVLSKVAEANPTSALAQDFGAKDHKTVKTREAVEKAKKRAGGSLIS